VNPHKDARSCGPFEALFAGHGKEGKPTPTAKSKKDPLKPGRNTDQRKLIGINDERVKKKALAGRFND
jgi:hypothetical protein